MGDFEAAVIGAGAAGLAAALALAHKGVAVALVGPPAGGHADRRTTALIGPSVRLLENLGAWRGSDPQGLTPGSNAGRAMGSADHRLRRPSIDETERATASPPPLWGRDRVGGIAEHRRSGVPPPLAPPHKGEGDPVGACLSRVPGSPAPSSLSFVSDPQGLTPSGAPICAVRIADDRGGLIRAPEVLFRAAEIGLDSFGVNLPNSSLLAALDAAARCARRLTRIETAGVTALEPAAAGVRLGLAEGGSIEAGLAVAADGRASKASAAAGIEVRAWSYPQAAVVTSFAHSRPHGDTVNELHRQAGPLTTVPLPGRRSALVWVERPEEARRLTGLDDAAFAAELEERLQGVLGSVGELEPRASYPLAGRRAERMGARRIALVGEAAHVVPPIGAQGLNLGLRDAATLADCVSVARARGEDIGGEAMLSAYDRARRLDVVGRSLSIDLLNRSLLTALLPVEALRLLAVHVLAGLPPLRRLLMQEGAGVAGPLPSLMR